MVGKPVYLRHDLEGLEHGHPCGIGKIRLDAPRPHTTRQLHKRRSCYRLPSAIKTRLDVVNTYKRSGTKKHRLRANLHLS